MKMRRTSETECPSKGRTHIHNVKFYNLQPRSIQCMAYNAIWKKLALSRNDGSIEIWDVRHAPCLERTIPKSPENSVEGLAWSAERLFSAGLNGELVEWNLQTLKPRHKQNVTGNAIWCLDVTRDGNDIAIGTEEGYINLFDIEDNQFRYKTLFDKQEGRVLCCRFDASGNYLVTGSQGAIRIWNTRTGHAIHKMNVSSKLSKVNQETIVWSLQVLQDFTIISGDSRGHVSIWDGKTASQIETHQVLKADVLAVAVNEEEDKLFCAGIEPTIRIYAKTKIRRDDMTYYRWIKYLQRRAHDHDVKALVCAQDNVYSGGVDGFLAISSASKTRSTILGYGPFLQQPCVTVAAVDRLLLLRYPQSLEIWRMGSTNGEQDLGEQMIEAATDGAAKPKLLALKTVPKKLLEFKSKNEELIVCATLSPNGRWLCYSTHNEIRLFHFVPGRDNGKQKRATQLVRIKDLPEQLAPASHVHFTADSMRLFVVNRETKQIMIFAMLATADENELDTSTSPPLDFVECIDTSKHIKDSIKLFTVSMCGSYIVAASTDRSIAVWSVYKGKHFKHQLNLPRYTAATTALSIHAEQPRLVAAFADGKIFEYDLDEMCFTCSDLDRFVSNSEFYSINNIVLDSRNPNIFVMQNQAKIFVVERCRGEIEDETNPDTKRAKSSKDSEDKKVDGLRLKMEKTYENLLHLDWLSSEELVAVCANPKSLIEHLPNPFKEKLFRTM